MLAARIYHRLLTGLSEDNITIEHQNPRLLTGPSNDHIIITTTTQLLSRLLADYSKDYINVAHLNPRRYSLYCPLDFVYPRLLIRSVRFSQSL